MTGAAMICGCSAVTAYSVTAYSFASNTGAPGTGVNDRSPPVAVRSTDAKPSAGGAEEGSAPVPPVSPDPPVND